MGVPTLNTVADLRDVSFGHRYPRQGLRLLHWLANNWINFSGGKDGMMTAARDPASGAFGFHPFHNTEKILPPLNDRSRYFEVGNLYAAGAEMLPFSPTPAGGNASNTDRVVVRMEPGLVVAEVYVTEHVPQHKRFRAESTRRVSRHLIHDARNLSQESFLQQAGYSQSQSHGPVIHEQAYCRNGEAAARNSVCNCIVL